MSDAIKIDANRAIGLLYEAVNERGGDYVYPVGDRCTYAADGDPSCMVGLALSKAGISVTELESMDASTFGAIEYVDFPERLELTDGAIAVFSEAQRVQDSGKPWGLAYNSAAKEALVHGVTLAA